MEQQVITSEQGLTELAGVLDARRAERVLVLTGPRRRHLSRFAEALSQSITVFDGAEVHVPEDVVAAATEVFADSKPDAVIALGGGSSIGLGKALRLRYPETYFVAIPTTYAGSERTEIYGIRGKDGKQTGRDARVRPDLAVYVPALSAELPRTLTIQSLLNALAHPVAVLTTANTEEKELREEAQNAVRLLVNAARQLSELPQRLRSRRNALAGCAAAGACLDRGRMGEHHRLAHLLGGKLRLAHAPLHAALLPHSLHALRESHPEAHAAIATAAGHEDLAAELQDLLRRVGAPTALFSLGVEAAEIDALLAEIPLESPSRELIRAAAYGRRTSARVRRADWGLELPVSLLGPELPDAAHVVVALHGWGSAADDALRQVRELAVGVPGLTVVAPQAPARAWYEGSYRDPVGPSQEAALALVGRVLARVHAHVPPERITLYGFSQGACVAAEYFARHRGARRLISIGGARLGGAAPSAPVDLAGTHAFIGVAERDPWFTLADIERNAALFRDAGAEVSLVIEPGDLHDISTRQRILVGEMLGRSDPFGTMGGYGGVHETEALPGALPIAQNSPHPSPYGLYAEQVNATGFVAPRAENRRSWLYRVRPAAQTSQLQPLPHPTFGVDFIDRPPAVNLSGWRPLPLPREPTDFVDGLHTVGGAGDPSLRRGYAVHVYAANRDMEGRAFYDADGELLIVPQEGELTLLTELGALSVPPGHVAVIPRGLRFSVLVPRGGARGYIGEVYGRHFELPERGPVGANGLTEARDLRSPHAWFEDRVAPGFRITAKLGGALYQAKQDHSPFDVVAWHGNYAPYIYDLMRFSPVTNGRFDHPDPSIYTVLSAPLDELGAHTLDFVFFPPRWDVSEGTFRPPFFHRNATTEINGIIRDPEGDAPPFYAGGCFITPSMTPHGVRAESVEGFLGPSDADEPHRLRASSMWFQFESALPIRLSRWAEESPTRIADWHAMWGSYRSHFDPSKK